MTFLVVSRPGHACVIPQGVKAEWLDSPQLDISSSDIRRRFQAGERPAEVPAAVLEYIVGRGLYGSGHPEQ